MDGLAEDLVDDFSYEEAVQAGMKSVPWKAEVNIQVTAGKWTKHIRPYADKVPNRIAENLNDTMKTIAPGGASDEVAATLKIVDDVLEGIRSQVTRYAEPSWGAGWNGYGDALQEKNILMAWELESDSPCPDCEELASNSPYEEMPTWPGEGDTECLDHCKCSVTADSASWDAALGDET